MYSPVNYLFAGMAFVIVMLSIHAAILALKTIWVRATNYAFSSPHTDSVLSQDGRWVNIAQWPPFGFTWLPASAPLPVHPTWRPLSWTRLRRWRWGSVP